MRGERLHDRIVRGAADEHGQTAAEYAAALAFVCAVLIITVQLFGGQVASLYDRVLAAFS